MWDKVHIFFTEEFQITNVEGLREIENHHYNTTVVIVASQIHWWVLQLLGEALRKNSIFALASSHFPRKYLLITVAILPYIYKFFETLPSRKWSLIPLPLSVVWTYHF